MTATSTTIPGLVGDLKNRRCVLFAGAGLSAWANLPTWSELLQKLIRAVPEAENKGEELQSLLKRGRVLEVGEYCKSALNDQRFATILQESLALPATVALPEIHQLLSCLPFCAVVTTNYDQLLEQAFARHDAGRLPKVITYRDISSLGPLLFEGGFFVLKAHGDITRPETLILSTRDYQRLMHNGDAYNTFFSSILLTKRFLFTGYSLQDPDFRMIIERQFSTFRGYLPEHYALMTGVGPIEEHVLARTANVRIINYSDSGRFEDLLAFLKALVRDVNGVEPPSSPKLLPPENKGRVPGIMRPKISKVALKLALKEDQIVASIQRSESEQITAKVRVQLPDLYRISELLQKEPTDASAPLAKYVTAAQHLTECLPATITSALSSVPPHMTVVLNVATELAGFPWEWIRVSDDFLLRRNPVVRTSGISDRVRGYASPKAPTKILVIGDPRGDLNYARLEAAEVKKAYPPSILVTKLIGCKATLNQVSYEILNKEYDVIHFAGGGWFDIKESYLDLANGSVLRASDLRSLLSLRPPAILVLNSHYTAFLPAGLLNPQKKTATGSVPSPATHVPGLSGFSRVAVSSGVGVVIGCFGNVSDRLSRAFGRDLHVALACGKNAAEALHEARVSSSKKGERFGDASWVLYTATGYPELALPV